MQRLLHPLTDLSRPGRWTSSESRRRTRLHIERLEPRMVLDAKLLRFGEAAPYELYNLTNDPWERHNLIDNSARKPLVDLLSDLASIPRTAVLRRERF